MKKIHFEWDSSLKITWATWTVARPKRPSCLQIYFSGLKWKFERSQFLYHRLALKATSDPTIPGPQLFCITVC